MSSHRSTLFSMTQRKVLITTHCLLNRKTTSNKNKMSSSNTPATNTNASYRVLRHLPPFYTLQPNTQTQSKQLQCRVEFLLDAAVAAYKECGALGIVLHPHSAVFRSPMDVQRVLPSAGARAVLRSMMETHGGYRVLPFAIETGDDENANDALDSEAIALAQKAEAQLQLERQQRAGEKDEFDFADSGASPASPPNSAAAGGGGAIFLNCDAVIVLALSCEKLVDAMNKWHEEESTSNVFSVGELAEDKDLTKRIAQIVSNASPGGGSSSAELGEEISLIGKNFQAKKESSSPAVGGGVGLAPLSNESVIEAIMTTEHPAMVHLKRPALLSGSGGSLGLKFG